MSACGRGCVKTQNRPLEIVSKLGEFSVEVSCLLTGRYRLVSQSIASYAMFEGDFWGDTDAEFSHSLGRKLPLISVVFSVPERPLPVKADVQILTLEISLPSDQYTPVSGP